MSEQQQGIPELLTEMRSHISEIHGFDIKDWDALGEIPPEKQRGILGFLKKVKENEWQGMEDVHQLPCYCQESMDNMMAMFDPPIHAEHKMLLRHHRRFKKRWKRLQERLNGTKADSAKTKAGDDSAKAVD